MVRAILDDRKTVTRRLIVCRSKRATDFEIWLQEAQCPYGEPGDRLWVRETWAGDQGDIRYAADGDSLHGRGGGRWRPSIHMPRWASRLTLEVVSVRIERLHDITAEDILADGIGNNPYNLQAIAEHGMTDKIRADLRHLFMCAWCEIHDRESWDANPWVWRVEFRRVMP